MFSFESSYKQKTSHIELRYHTRAILPHDSFLLWFTHYHPREQKSCVIFRCILPNVIRSGNAWRKEGYLLWKSWAVSYRGVEGPPWGHPRRISHVVPWSRCYYVKEHIERLLAPNMHLTLCSANVSSLSRKADKIRTNGCRTTINLK